MKFARQIVIILLLLFILIIPLPTYADSSSKVIFETNDIEKFTFELEKQLEKKNSEVVLKFIGETIDSNQILYDLLKKNAFIKCSITEIQTSIEQYTQNNYTIYTYFPKYITTKKQDKLIDDKIDSIIKEIITADMVTYERVKAIHDYIVTNYKYDEQMINYSDYDLLFKGSSVCNGYAMLTYKMLNRLNIPTLLVTGSANTGNKTESHVWNLVNIGGYWFNLDTTWDDPIPDQQSTISYDYYLLNDDVFNTNHFPEKELSVPKAYMDYNSYIAEFASVKNDINLSPTTKGINIRIHDSYVDFTKLDNKPVLPFIENGRTLVPIRAVFENLGFNVSWDNKAQTATIINGNDILVIQPNKDFTLLNNNKISIDAPARLVNGRIVVPVRLISEAFNKTVFWDKNTQTVIIY